MQNKILSILIAMLFLTTTYSIIVIAGTEENPEIIDNVDDTDLDFLDIESAWFYEEEENSEYLYISMKIKELKEDYSAIFAVRWTYNDIVYVSGLDTFYYRDNVFRSGIRQRATYWQWKNMPECIGIFDLESKIITWKILKSNIGNPQKDEILTYTKASAVPGFPISFLYFIIGIDHRDFAPDESNIYGDDYTILY